MRNKDKDKSDFFDYGGTWGQGKKTVIPETLMKIIKDFEREQKKQIRREKLKNVFKPFFGKEKSGK